MFNQNKKSSGIGNFFLALLCIILFTALAGLLIWNGREEAAKAKELQKLAESEEYKTARKEENKAETETANGSPVEDTEPQETEIRGISCWGDDLISEEESGTYSYRAVLQNLLNENGYDLPVIDKTLRGGGTLSMMTMAGVPEEEVQEFIDAHKEAANGQELYITETGIRDLTAEQLDRSDKDCIPVIFMGYYGGWNHNPEELVEQQQKILDTFENKEKFIIVAAMPMDGSVDSGTLDDVMNEKWGEHYISVAKDITNMAASHEGQKELAEVVFKKLEELGYIR